MLFNGHQSQRIANVWQENDQTAEFLRSLLAQQMGILLEGMHSWMWVPLAVKGRMSGIGIAHVELENSRCMMPIWR